MKFDGFIELTGFVELIVDSLNRIILRAVLKAFLPKKLPFHMY